MKQPEIKPREVFVYTKGATDPEKVIDLIGRDKRKFELRTSRLDEEAFDNVYFLVEDRSGEEVFSVAHFGEGTSVYAIQPLKDWDEYAELIALPPSDDNKEEDADMAA